MKIHEPESMEQDWTCAYLAESSNPPLAPTGAPKREAPQKQAELHAIEVKGPTAPGAINAESAGTRKLPPREALTNADFEVLAQSSISREAAERASLFRVNHEEAREYGFGTKGSGDLAGMVFSFRNLEGD
jgi:hypothetical protein